MITTKPSTQARDDFGIVAGMTTSGRRKAMENAERVTELRPPRTINGQSGGMAIRPGSEAATRRQREFISPVAVSQSSYLNENDRHYRAAQTVKNAVELAERSADGLLRLDARLREAEVEGASPRALAGIERLEEVFSHSACGLVYDFVSRPYERW
jgi:hypothetical protein